MELAKKRSRGEVTNQAIRDAAVRMFSEEGYHGATLRKLAEGIGIQAGSLYNHIENKQELLFKILYEIMQDLVEGYQRRSKGVTDPVKKLDIFVQNHIEFHTERQQEVYIGNMELRNLEPENLAKLVVIRDVYQKAVLDLLTEGKEAGRFDIDDPRAVAFAILGMLNSVATWYRPSGPLKPLQIAAQYQRFVRNIVQIKP